MFLLGPLSLAMLLQQMDWVVDSHSNKCSAVRSVPPSQEGLSLPGTGGGLLTAHGQGQQFIRQAQRRHGETLHESFSGEQHIVDDMHGHIALASHSHVSSGDVGHAVAGGWDKLNHAIGGHTNRQGGGIDDQAAE